MDNAWWASEHYFQAQKFGKPDAEEIRQAKTPKAAMMGRDRSRHLRSDWQEVKDGIMRQAVLRKFQTHADIREVLLATSDELIVNAFTSLPLRGQRGLSAALLPNGASLFRSDSLLQEPPGGVTYKQWTHCSASEIH